MRFGRLGVLNAFSTYVIVILGWAYLERNLIKVQEHIHATSFLSYS